MYRLFGKRLIELVLCLITFIVISPLFALVMILVWMNLRNPVFFRQRRVGLNGKPFTIYKFRTMNDVHDIGGNPLPDAERLTTFGVLLRKCSLDELPEFINVIKGEMSLIGPRPLLMQYMDRYTPKQMRRHEVRPGITGWAQVNGRNLLTWEQRFTLDTWYVDHVSFRLDLKIMVLTVWKILKREGINQPGHVTMDEFKGSSGAVET